MHEKLNSPVVEFAHKFMADQHTGVAVNDVKASWQDEHRSKLDWDIHIEPVQPPYLSCCPKG